MTLSGHVWTHDFASESREGDRGRILRVILVEMDANSSGLLAEKLRLQGFVPCLDTWHGGTPRPGICTGSRAIVLDLGQETASAAGMVRKLRQAGLDQPCLVLAAHDDWRDKIDALDAGADDFVLKPVRSEEVAARLRAMIRRGAGNATDVIVHGDLRLDLRVRCAWLGRECLELTRNEFRLLRLFLLEPEKVMTHQEIHRQLYPERAEWSPNAIEVQIARLRRKVGREKILTIRGLGYRFMNEGSPEDGGAHSVVQMTDYGAEEGSRSLPGRAASA